MTTPAKTENQPASTALPHSRRQSLRSGGCNRQASSLRPVSSSFPAFFQSPGNDPKGFLGFSGRVSVARS